MQRSPLGGRGFESFSEDPYLAGAMGAATVNGIQSTGVAATIKHYVANDQEHQRFT
jgi:beta-glucosidase